VKDRRIFLMHSIKLISNYVQNLLLLFEMKCEDRRRFVDIQDLFFV
jgi:hypothetical protein